MRNLIINKQTVNGLRFKGIVKVVDRNNLYTGEKRIEYYTAQPFKTHVSGARGTSQSEIFGTDISYDKTFVLTKKEFKELGFDENSVFFVEKEVEYASDGVTPLYDYRVVRIAETINEVVVAIKQVRDEQSRVNPEVEE